MCHIPISISSPHHQGAAFKSFPSAVLKSLQSSRTRTLRVEPMDSGTASYLGHLERRHGGVEPTPKKGTGNALENEEKMGKRWEK